MGKGRIGKHVEDVLGMTFNRLTVIARSGKTDRSKSIWWDCICSCGTVKTLRGSDIRKGAVKSCGCLQVDTCREVGRSGRRDITGRVFGRLTVIGDLEQRTRGRVLWQCRCECGNEAAVSGTNLRTGVTISCGCYRKEKSLLDLSGQVFGRLTVIRDSGIRRHHQSIWICSCECGAEYHAIGSSLKSGLTRSCGCLRRDTPASNRKEITGLKVGRLTVLRISERRKGRSLMWECECECGNATTVRGRELRSGTTLSCGCLMRETAGNLRRTHGLSHTVNYKRYLRTKREVAKLKRTPPWADMQAIKQVYMNRPEGMTVDHIIPLQGELVSGLHVASNLQYLTLSENSSKHNKFQPFIQYAA
jgi:hypothetical protein